MSRTIVVLGMLAKLPVPGVAWQTLHYLLGLRRLGFDVVYVEAHARTPSMLMRTPRDDGAALAAAYIDRVLRPYAIRWAFHALHDDGRVLGMSAGSLARAYREAELLINLHGGTEPREELAGRGRLIFLETDPVQLQIELHDGVRAAHEFLAPHAAFFTFAENLHGDDCTLPSTEGYDFKPTRQPVSLDLWDTGTPPGSAFRTVGNWHQAWRSVTYRGETYGWSKDTEWRKFLRLPCRTGQPFELALDIDPVETSDLDALAAHGWKLVDPVDEAGDVESYRRYVQGSMAELLVAKSMYVQSNSGWFSDRSACYLASGRPVVAQDTGIRDHLPNGDGLIVFSDLDEAVEGVQRVMRDSDRHRAAARRLAEEHFASDRVLRELLAAVDL